MDTYISKHPSADGPAFSPSFRHIRMVSIFLLCLTFAVGCAPRAENAGAQGELDNGKTETDRKNERISRLQQQIEAGKAQVEWEPWYQALAEINKSHHAADFHLAAAAERVLYDQTLIDKITDTSVLGDPSRLQGPLVMITDVARQLSSKGIDLLLVPVPPRAAVFPERLGIATPLAEGEAPPLLDWRLRSFFEVLEQQGIEVVDTLPLFLEGRTQPVTGETDPPSQEEHVFRRHDTHWTPYGASLIAEALGTRIRQYPWFAEVTQAQGQATLVESVEWKEMRGNLGMKLIDAGKVELSDPKEWFRARTVLIEGETESMDNRDSPILLMGDSFCLPEHGLPDHLLRNLGFRVDRVSISGGYLSSMLQALRMRDDGMAGKKLVIWVFGYHSLNRWGQWSPMPFV